MQLFAGKRRSWWVRTVFFILVLLLASAAAEYVLILYAERNWESLSRSRSEEYLTAAAREFSGLQRNARRIAVEVGSSPIVEAYLTGHSVDRISLFEQISRISHEQEVGIEVYDRSGNLVAWEGRSGPAHRSEVRIALDGQMTSYVTRTPVSSQLFITTPVRQEGKILGAILLRRSIEVSYPFSNSFVNREGLTETLSKDLGVPVEFNFSEGAEPRKDGRFASAFLFGIDSSKIGVVSVQRPARSAYIEGIRSVFQGVNSLLFALLTAVLALTAWVTIQGVSSAVIRFMAVSALIWGIRYGLLWFEIPSSLVTAGIFDPAQFASKFGGGLARSIGEMFLTALALTLNVGYAARLVLTAYETNAHLWRPPARFLRLLIAAAFTVVLFWALRGFGAAVRSAIFDSSLVYSDPRAIVPSFELAVMILNLLLVGLCLIVAGVGCSWLLISLFSPDHADAHRGNDTWILLAGLFALAAILFDVVQENPLMSTLYRLAFGLAILIVTFYLRRTIAAGRAVFTRGMFLVALGFSAALLYPLMEENARENDRRHIETLAAEVLRPADGWFTLIIEDALRGFASEQAPDVLIDGEPAEIERLAFTRWALSAACREGYTSIFAVTDSAGRPLSRFSIGGQVAQASMVEGMFGGGDSAMVAVREIGKGINAQKIYAGAVPIRTPSGSLLAFGHVTVVAGQQMLFRGETPAILRGASKGSLQSFYRPVAVAEFRGGKLASSSADVFPIGQSLSDAVAARLRDSGSAWAEEVYDDAAYETLYILREGTENEAVALSLRKPGVAGYLVGIVKMILYFALLALIFLGALYGFDRVRGERTPLSFRGKLLIALLITALIPLTLLALYGRLYAKERLLEETARILNDQTGVVASYLIDQAEGHVLPDSLPGTRAAEAIASDIDADFNLYVGRDLQATTRPELYDVGILERRLSGSAYAAVLLGGRRFHLETENIGRFQYAVGYRPLQDSTGAIAGVISVPMLYRQEKVEEEAARRNAFLFGVYAFVLIAVLAIATTFANRIAAPIQRLTEATKKVARGELEVTVTVPHADGEIKELVDSFGAMTRDLKKSRENLIRYERELAWKEMAKQVAHEIKNPLTPMKLSVQHLRRVYLDRADDFGEVLESVTKTVMEQIDTLSRIASEFSHFARMPKRQMQQCEINEVVRETLRLFEQDTNVTFELTAGPSLPRVTADREELRRAFINIVRNGIQAMDGRGVIAVSTARAGDDVRITIHDSGKGIPDEMKERLFQPNFSTKTDGMGMGLAIVKKTVDDLGGTVSIESEEGKGTTATILLPGDVESGSSIGARS